MIFYKKSSRSKMPTGPQIAEPSNALLTTKMPVPIALNPHSLFAYGTNTQPCGLFWVLYRKWLSSAWSYLSVNVAELHKLKKSLTKMMKIWGPRRWVHLATQMSGKEVLRALKLMQKCLKIAQNISFYVHFYCCWSAVHCRAGPAPTHSLVNKDAVPLRHSQLRWP